MKTRSQLFSEAVFGNVHEIATGDPANARKYRGLCRSAGSLVRNTGLLPALAFFAARGSREPQHHDLLRHLEHELNVLDLVTPPLPAADYPGGVFPLVSWLRGCDLSDYLRVSRDVLRLLTWHKRLAETLIVGIESSVESPP